MCKETDNDTSSNTIEMNEIPNEKGTSLNGVPFGPCLKTRKKRLSTEEIIDYINWALINDNMKMIKNNSLHTHTVCVPYYKAAPYNISHT